MSIINLHVLNVGHGDSIVLEFPENHWGLVDCCRLQKDSEPPALTFLKTKRVQKLDFVCLTHPHSDHFEGMLDVLRYFTSEGRRVEEFWDCGMEGRKMRYVTRKLAENQFIELQSLYGFVRDQAAVKKTIRYLMLSEGHCLSIGPIQINSYAPLGSDTWKYITEWGRNKKVDENLLSVVLIITNGTANLVLGSDTKSWEDILHQWRKDCEKIARDNRFDIVKVSHHGSLYGNHKGLWKSYTIPSKSVAVISAGSKYRFPHLETVTSIVREKIRLYSTNYRDFTKKVKGKETVEDLRELKISSLQKEVLQYFAPAAETYTVISPYHGTCSISIDKDRNSSVQTECNLPYIS